MVAHLSKVNFVNRCVLKHMNNFFYKTFVNNCIYKTSVNNWFFSYSLNRINFDLNSHFVEYVSLISS